MGTAPPTSETQIADAATAPAPDTDAWPNGHGTEWRRAVVDVAPMLVAYVPFAFVIGATITEGGPVSARWASSVLIMGGSAQLAVLQLLDSGAGVAVTIGTALALNARLLTYSASLAADWRERSRAFRLLAATSIIDPTWALAGKRASEGATAEQRHRYYVAMATVLCSGWVVLVTVGMVVGDRVDTSFASVAIPMSLFVMLVPRLGAAHGRVVAGVAAAVAVLAAGLPAGTGLLVATVVGVVAGEAQARRYRP